MAGPESEHIYGIQLRESANDGSDFANADADYRIAFIGEDGLWHAKDSAGTVSSPYTGGGLDEGTAFPGSPVADDLFYRTDRNKIYFYDGTRWLTTSVYSLPFTERVNQTQTGFAATGTLGNAPTRGASGDMYIDQFRITAFASSGAFDGTNHWTATLDKLDAANASTTISTLTMNSQTSNNWKEWVNSVGAVVVGSASLAFRIQLTKVLAAPNLICGAQVTYREVG